MLPQLTTFSIHGELHVCSHNRASSLPHHISIAMSVFCMMSNTATAFLMWDVTEPLSLAYMLRYVSIINSAQTLLGLLNVAKCRQQNNLIMHSDVQACYTTNQTSVWLAIFFSQATTPNLTLPPNLFHFACLTSRGEEMSILFNLEDLLCTEAYGGALKIIWVNTAGNTTNEHRPIKHR